jgi:hypothetical protein
MVIAAQAGMTDGFGSEPSCYADSMPGSKWIMPGQTCRARQHGHGDSDSCLRYGDMRRRPRRHVGREVACQILDKALAAAQEDECYQALKLVRRIIQHEEAVLRINSNAAGQTQVARMAA